MRLPGCHCPLGRLCGWRAVRVMGGLCGAAAPPVQLHDYFCFFKLSFKVSFFFKLSLITKFSGASTIEKRRRTRVPAQALVELFCEC